MVDTSLIKKLGIKPKQRSKVPTDLNRDILWKIFPNSEWRPVTQISIDEIWSALRFRPKAEVGT